MKYLIVSLFCLINFQNASADATAVFDCGYTSDGIYRCSDLKLRATPTKQQFEVPLRKKISSKVLSAKIVGYSKQLQDKTVTGYYDIKLQFCGPMPGSSESNAIEWKKKNQGNYLINYSNEYDNLAWILGGVNSTIKEIHFSLIYHKTIYSSLDKLTDICYINTRTIKLFCQLLTDYDGAGCNFVINNSQTLAIELFRNNLNQPSLILY
ncbi:MAG: hypothetical protein L6Q37_08125 [Bdellovibrionaceae bacterium]|nr:hypothetical protein [Pseudobdellovibrionaceae bacterium]NUM57332.1 hypothetical protein [Pseudobdellovibrionaceae bacterium]